MVIVQHSLTQFYLQSFAEWSSELNDAWVFANMTEAVNFCELWGLKDVQIIVAGEQDVHEFPMPLRGHSFLVHRLKTIPIVLPRTDSHRN